MQWAEAEGGSGAKNLHASFHLVSEISDLSFFTCEMDQALPQRAVL